MTVKSFIGAPTPPTLGGLGALAPTARGLAGRRLVSVRCRGLSCRHFAQIPDPDQIVDRGADGVEDVQQQGPQQSLRRDRGAPRAGVEPIERGRELGQHLVDHLSDGPQGMILGPRASGGM